MADWQPAAQADDVWSDAVNPAQAGDVKLVIVKIDDQFCAYRDACPHEKFPLSEWGELENGVIICGRHFWEFDAATGKHISRIERPGCDLTRLPLRIDEGTVYVDVELAQG